MIDELMYPSSAINDICKRNRDEVLDYLLKRVTEIDHSGECMGGYQHECMREDCTTCTVEFVIKEIRQKAGE